MYLSELKPARGSRHKPKRLGRGESSGLGKTSGRGNKGQKARKSGNTRIGFEGGQMPIYRRLPKRGFTNVHATPLHAVNVSTLALKFEAGATVDLDALKAAGVLPKVATQVKVLGNGDLGHALTVKATKFSASAKQKIEQAGGTAEVVGQA